MPFIRSTRDKRGYDTTYVMHAYRPAQGPGRTRVLYLFRSPSHVKIGRRALDEEAREGLTHTHPDLNFDWMTIDRELAEPAPESRDRDRDRDRDRGSRHARGQASSASSRPSPGRPPARQEPPPPEAVPDDPSLLGRTLGAATAQRLRARYADALQRIARRARTPEDRDRLSDRAGRLNPDDWADEAAVRAGVLTIDSAFDALALELPQRRRGRRGGRRRPEGEGSSDAPEASSASEAEPSAIMADVGEDDAEPQGDDGARADWRAAAAGGRRDREPGADDRGPAEPTAPTNPGIPGDR